MKVKIKRVHESAKLPVYATDGSGCFDIHGITDKSIVLYRGDAETIRTGLSFEIPPGHVMLIFGRSGHAFKHGIRLANCTAVIDSDYRGEVMVRIVRDHESEALPMSICSGDRIAQGMVIPYGQVQFEEADELSSTDRGFGGFGSTGRN